MLLGVDANPSTPFFIYWFGTLHHFVLRQYKDKSQVFRPLLGLVPNLITIMNLFIACKVAVNSLAADIYHMVKLHNLFVQQEFSVVSREN